MKGKPIWTNDRWTKIKKKKEEDKQDEDDKG